MNRLLLLAGLFASATSAPAQSLAERVARAPDGEVRISYTGRPGVCGNGENMIGFREPGVRGIRSVHVRWNYRRRSNEDWERECIEGPVRLALQVERGQVTDLEAYVGGGWGAGGGRVTDLGTVPAATAAAYLLSLAESGAQEAGKKAIYPATLAEGPVWRDLLRLARSSRAPEGVRSQAVFWLGHAAGDQATRGLSDLVDDGNVERSIQERAVFALSQRPRDEGIPALIRVARTHRDPQVRKKALFWLGQSKDPRALALFEEILTRS